MARSGSMSNCTMKNVASQSARIEALEAALKVAINAMETAEGFRHSNPATWYEGKTGLRASLTNARAVLSNA